MVSSRLLQPTQGMLLRAQSRKTNRQDEAFRLKKNVLESEEMCSSQQLGRTPTRRWKIAQDEKTFPLVDSTKTESLQEKIDTFSEHFRSEVNSKKSPPPSLSSISSSSSSTASSTKHVSQTNTTIVQPIDIKDEDSTNCPFHSSKENNNTMMMMMSGQGKCPFLHQKSQVTHSNIVQLETSQKTHTEFSEFADCDKPRHTVGCTPHECHGALMEKNGFGAVSDKDSCTKEEKIHEAVAFLHQFAEETGVGQIQIEDRIDKVKTDIMTQGTYKHTFEELQFGCRVAWRNSGRCIMRKVSFSLELRDCRSVYTADDCFNELVSHLLYAANGGAIKSVISVFPPKPDGMSSPVRIWNPQLIGYAAYKLPNGEVMGDPARLDFTALCVKFGWEPPEEKSDFDILPILISDETTGHDQPKVFELPDEAVLEVDIHHPDHDLFSELNLRWYAIPALSNFGVDIGGVMYQTCPFNGWYQITEICRDLLDKQRYNLAEAVAIACDIPRTKILSLWRDDVELQFASSWKDKDCRFSKPSCRE